MSEKRPFFSLISEETAHLKWFEAFMRGRMELEQQMILGLQALLEGAPPPTDCKLLWHRTLEKLLDGTQDELHTRTEELERLKGQMQAMGMSIANAEMYIRDLNLEVERLESTEGVDSAQAATASLHKDWLYIKSVDVSVQKNVSNLFSLGRAPKEKLEIEKGLQAHRAREALKKYYKQDLTYRRVVLQQRQSQAQFLNSIPDQVQKYGTKYWTAVRDTGKVMESFANYLRNISSTCNSSGSEIWASAKNIKPLVDANCHTEAIEFAYHQSPVRFSPIHYRNPGSTSHSPSGQTILFGCPLELCTFGELKKIPPVLEYLLGSVLVWPPSRIFDTLATEEYWPLVNELEQGWIGVEESDRAVISKLVQYDNRSLLIMVYLLALPKPVFSSDDLKLADEAVRNLSSLTWNALNIHPTKLAILQAIQSRLSPSGLNWDITNALTQGRAGPGPGFLYLCSLASSADFLRSPVSNVPEEDQ